MARPQAPAILAARQQAELLELHGAARQSALHAPLPNLFRATFEQAQRPVPGEHWLQQKLEAFDAGGPLQRRQLLKDFLEYVRSSKASSMEELFSNQAHLFFLRLTSWFSMTLSTLFELPLQLKVFLTFLEFGEETFIHAFFESGAVVALIQSLSDDAFDVPDEVRCLVLVLLHKLASNGKQHKELLCSQGLIPNTLACVADALRWETLKCAGRLLSELFLSNPQNQAEVLDGFQAFLSHKVFLAQRVGAQGILSLLQGDKDNISPLLRESVRHQTLVELLVKMLNSKDLRVCTDACCLLFRLVCLFACDELLVDFAKSQLPNQQDVQREWFRMELESHQLQRERSEQQQLPALGGPQQGTHVHLHQRIAEAIAGAEGLVLEDMAGGQEFVQHVYTADTEFREDFRAEAPRILKFGLVLFLTKRNPKLSEELVRAGLTEWLLMRLLDVKHPVRQAVALPKLHQLRAVSGRAQLIMETILGEEVLNATSLDQFTSMFTSDMLTTARFRLRNLQMNGQTQSFSSEEHQLHLQILENHLDSIGIVAEFPPETSATAFLTEPDAPDSSADRKLEEDRGKAEEEKEKEDSQTASAGSPPGSRGQPCGGRISPVEKAPAALEEMSEEGFLPVLVDPLGSAADEHSSIMQELRKIEVMVGLGVARHPPAPPRSRRTRSSDLRTSHRPSLQHRRALALKSTPPAGPDPQEVEPRRWQQRAPHTARATISRASSELTDVSLQCGNLYPNEDKLPPLTMQQYMMSLEETTVGPELMSSMELSHELPSWAYEDAFAAEDSRQTLGTDSLAMTSLQQLSGDALDEDPLQFQSTSLRLLERTPITAVMEVPPSAGGATSSSRGGSQRARRVVQVSSPPYHDCVAFSKAEIEEDRKQLLAQQPGGLLSQSTLNRFQNLRAAGPFPRRGVGAVGSLQKLQAVHPSPGQAQGLAQGQGQEPDAATGPSSARARAEVASGWAARLGSPWRPTAITAPSAGPSKPSFIRRKQAYRLSGLQPLVPPTTKPLMNFDSATAPVLLQ